MQWLQNANQTTKALVLLTSLLIASFSDGNTAQQPARDVSKAQARPSREWVRDGVVYEIYPRAFSSQGNFNGITARLDNLKDLGVNILWLMPIHPIGQEKKKGTIGSPNAVRD
jgi:alpha-amylase